MSKDDYRIIVYQDESVHLNVPEYRHLRIGRSVDLTEDSVSSLLFGEAPGKTDHDYREAARHLFTITDWAMTTMGTMHNIASNHSRISVTASPGGAVTVQVTGEQPRATVSYYTHLDLREGSDKEFRHINGPAVGVWFDNGPDEIEPDFHEVLDNEDATATLNRVGWSPWSRRMTDSRVPVEAMTTFLTHLSF